MPTKTDRILSYLPRTFSAFPRPTALYSVVDAFGSELLKAENSLAALMLAHWVDHADKGAEFISDLACIASLYGLAPRGTAVTSQDSNQSTTTSQTSPTAGNAASSCPPQQDSEESVEEFRDHLKRYVRTFLDGTVTVQGILRITAEALGLHIADEYAQMDSWWTRPSDAFTSVIARGEDAARLLFGVDAAAVSGQQPRSASITGTKNLSGGADLRGASILRISVDGAAAVDVDCAQGASNSAAVHIKEIKSAISTKLGSLIVSDDGQFLTLTSSTVGATSRLEVQEVPGDAAQLLLGLLPRTYHGSGETHARVTGTIDLHNGVDLSTNHYLRLQVDGNQLAEIDCAGSVANKTTLDEITKAVNDALGIPVASPSPDGHFLTLTSPTTGFRSSIAFLPAAAQDAQGVLFGSPPSFTTGVDALAARVIGTNDLSKGVDLSTRSHVRISVDARPPITIACAGANPAQTLLAEIVNALNAALGSSPPIATQDGRFIRLTSPTTGPNSALVLEALPENEAATALIFGIGPRIFQGTAASRAHLAGTPDLSAGADLRARHVVQVAVDGGTPIEVDLWSHASKLSAVTLDELVTMFNNALGPGIATQDGSRLTLASPTSGGASRIELDSLEKINNQRFVTRAFITDEAVFTIFGFFTRHAQGTAATQAHVIGTVDLSRGVDLREQRFLRIGIDGAAPQEINCAKNSPRPRAASLEEIATSIKSVIGEKNATSDGQHLVLTSQTQGTGSKIILEPPRSADALDTLLGQEPGVFHGSDATRVSFVGTADLSSGVNLRDRSKINLGIDKIAPKEIDCAGANASNTTLQEIVNAINSAFLEIGGAVASSDDKRIFLTSPTTGQNSKIVFAAPSSSDATKDIFGISAPRDYSGADAAPAKVTGHDLSGTIDLSIAHHLVIAVDGKPAVDVNFATNITDLSKVTLPAIVQEINKQLQPNAASDDGTHLILSSSTTGLGAQIELQRYTGGDARAILLGSDVPPVTMGADPTPAVITGDVDLLAPVDLSERRMLRIAIDGQRPLNLDVAGAEPAKTSLGEIVTKINSIVPGLASVTDTDHLRLTSPTAGEESQLDMFPLRTLNLIEYPPTPIDEIPRSVHPGDKWFEINDGAADTELSIDLSPTRGAVGPSLVNLTSGLRLRLLIILRGGELVQIRPDPNGQSGVTATITGADGKQSQVPSTKILVGPLGAQTSVPFKGRWALSGGKDHTSSTLQLNNPLAPVIVMLSARQAGPEGDKVTVSVNEANLSQSASEPVTVTVDGQPGRVSGWLSKDATGYRLTHTPGENGVPFVRLLAGRAVILNAHLNRPVVVYGPLHHRGDGGIPLMVVTYIADLFDVTVGGKADDGKVVVENYAGVSIGTGFGPDFPEEITWQILTRPSALIRATQLQKGAILTLPRGRTTWVYLDGDGDRFESAAFERAHFASGMGKGLAIFDISRFSPARPEQETTVFAGPIAGAPVTLQFHWIRRQPGAFVVNLPDDLPDQFGSRFNQVRFGMAKGAGEIYKGVVTEPETDTDYIKTRLAASKLVAASTVSSVPLGWDPVPIPFHHPRSFNLTGGTDGTPAQLYLKEEGVPTFIQLSAQQQGVWGNDISISVSRSDRGPAYYDVTVSYAGVRLENARQAVKGGKQLPTASDALLKPGPIGILQAKAAGIQADVTRDRTY